MYTNVLIFISNNLQLVCLCISSNNCYCSITTTFFVSKNNKSYIQKMKLPCYQNNTPLDPSFDDDLKDVHLVYDYDATDSNGRPEKWRYEIWFFSENKIVYAIHGGPMAGRINYQTVAYQCVRPGEIWQINWLEETGTVVSIVYDIVNKTVNGLLCFSKGHWENSEAAHGDKRNPDDFARWRNLAKQGIQTDRFVLVERAHILKSFKGQGDLEPIEPDAITF
uniref:Phenolic acid decarboxylase n=2 Tax=Dekkera bruxellensis TaxID=5007 RepID=A0A1L5YR15_DEKBR|nr:phenolic acid decarboxylase [Brettanomyces bruxellensis]APP94192.1 phenolic acid decarboxylase [Brettanomyces bruxellensis]